MSRRDPLANPEPLIRRVYSYVAYRVGEGPDAEDITADVFERALRYRSSYDASKGEPIAWLIGIARRAVNASSTRETTPGVVESIAPLDVEGDTILKLSLASAVERLASRDQELIALRYGADLKASQIGALLDMNTNAVEVALHRALATLRSILTAEDQA
jgi:RNA polymerase sigma-70 factor (ECF subfamily)